MRSGKVRAGWTGQLRSSQVRSGEANPGQVVQVMSVQDRTGRAAQFRLGKLT